MTTAETYSYTPQQLSDAFTEISATLFAGITTETIPKLMITAGVQSSGKTWLLEKNLLPSGRYGNYVRLYLPKYREKHPQYQSMLKHGVLHAYEHTDAFIRELGGKIFNRAFTDKLNIIMECAFDTIDFAKLPEVAVTAGYQFEVHIVACTQPFAFMSGFQRAFKSLKKLEPERFVKPGELKSSLAIAHAVVFALETAAKQSDGSQIHLYERGMGALKERLLRASSVYTKDTPKPLLTTAVVPPYSYEAFKRISTGSIKCGAQRREFIKECHQMLLQTSQYAEQIPDFVYDALYSRIFKYAQG